MSGLCISEVGVLLAWVQGGGRYATRVELLPSGRAWKTRLTSTCSCPVGEDCKHAAAVVIDYLAKLEAGAAVSPAPESDRRWAILAAYGSAPDDEARDRGPVRKHRTRKREDVEALLRSRSRGEIVRLVLGACSRSAEARRAIIDECAAREGQVDRLVEEARAEIRSLTSEDAWWDEWRDEGRVPQYSGLKERLTALLDHGHSDEVLDLGRELMLLGSEQIGRSDDAGETAIAIGDCMEAVLKALLDSKWPAEDRILYAIDVSLADDYGISPGFPSVLERRWPPDSWSLVADRLRERLDGEPRAEGHGEDPTNAYSRERLGDHAIHALDRAGRADEATTLCVAEARETGGYVRAVRRLLERNDVERAAELAAEGLQETPRRLRGIVAELQDLLCDVARKKGDWALTAAVAAERFFVRPSVAGYRDLLAAARKGRCETVVREAAIAFLETGRRPDQIRETASKRGSAPRWPLPEPPGADRGADTRARSPGRRGPWYDVVIDLAIDEDRPDDVMEWFDKRQASRGASRRWVGRSHREDLRIAEAVEASHPDRAIAIYRELAEATAAQANTRTYPLVAEHLKRIRKVLERHGRAGEWAAVVADVRTRHARKRRLMEVIDGIEGRAIVKRKRRG